MEHGPGPAGGARDLAGLAVLAGAAWALLDLGRRRAFLERLAGATRRAVELTVVTLAAWLALLLCVAGAGGPGGNAAWLALAALAAVHLAGLALPFAAPAWPSHARVAAFLALTWWAPALLLDADGWQGWTRELVAPSLSLAPRPSDSPEAGAILPRALLAGAAVLAGALTARGTTRIA